MKLIYLIIISQLSINYSVFGNWIQVGQELVGATTGERFGTVVKLSSDGITLMGMSAGSYYDIEKTGIVRAYRFDGTNWEIQGTISGEEYFPITNASLSHDGNILSTYSGSISRIKEYPIETFYSNGYRIIGDGLDYYAINGNASKQIYISNDNISVHFNYEGGSTSWILGNFEEIKSICLTKSGNHFAFGNHSEVTSEGSEGYRRGRGGARSNSSESNITEMVNVESNITGMVNVYEFNGSWNQKGNPITGNASFGENVALNIDGTIVAVGAPVDNNYDGISTGSVNIYEYDSSLNDWVQRGQTIFGDASSDKCGGALAINEQGSIVAIGYKEHDGNGVDSGMVRAFEFNGSYWEQIGQDIYGEAANDFFGESLEMNAEGTRIAISSEHNDSNGVDAGHIRVFDFIPNQEPVIMPVYELKVFKSTDLNSWELIETKNIETSEEDLFIKAEIAPKASN